MKMINSRSTNFPFSVQFVHKINKTIEIKDTYIWKSVMTKYYFTFTVLFPKYSNVYLSCVLFAYIFYSIEDEHQ